jgi:CHAT domain-containing protein
MSFYDGFGLIQFEFPPGWGYDPVSSSFEFVVIRPWDRPHESVTVALRKTATPLAAADDEWLAAVGVQMPAFTGARLLRKLSGRTVAGFRSSESEPANRSAIVRGSRFDIGVGHIGGSNSSEVLTDALTRVVSSVEAFANAELPESTTESAINTLFESLDSLKGETNPDKARELLEQFIERGRAAIVHGRLGADRSLVDAGLGARIVGLAGAAVSGNLSTLYLAEQAVTRLAGQSGPLPEDVDPADADTDAHLTRLHQLLVDSPDLAPLWAKLRKELRRLDGSRVTADGHLTAPLPRASAVAMFANGFLVAGRRDAQDPRPNSSSTNLRLAVETAASLLVTRQVSSRPPHTAMAFQPSEIATLHESSTLLQRVRTAAFGTPVLVDHAELRVSLMRRYIEVTPGVRGARDQLAHDLAQLVLARARLSEPGALVVNRRLVDEARRSIRPATPRATKSLVELALGTVLIGERAPAKAIIGAFARARKLHDPVTPVWTEEMVALSVAALCDDGRVAEAAGLLEPLKSPDLPTPVSVTIAQVYVAVRQGDFARARDLVAVALALPVLGASALHTEARGLLEVASRAFRESDPDLADDMARTLLRLDRLYAMTAFAGEESRVLFGDEGDQRVRAEQLVERLIGRERLDAALEVADDARAVVLRADLGAPAREAPVSAPPVPDGKPITDAGATLLPSFAKILRTRIENELRDRGGAVGLPSADLVRAATDGGRQALVIQPVGDRLHLLHIDRRGEIHAATSSTSRSACMEHIDRLRSEFGIEVAPSVRGENPFLPALRRSRSSWEDASTALHIALFDPVAAWLDDAPLVVVPYGDLALLPWNAVGPRGAPLIGRVGVSIAPSLATLDALRTARTSRPRPDRIVIVADPLIERRHRLAPLPGARLEAGAIIDALAAVGIVTNTIGFFTGAEATESEVSRAAAGADLVHLACHAALRDPVAMSALFLAAGTGDGLLMATEVGEVPLRDAVVFLSACETGGGTPTVDGVLGLSRAFLKAGARTVIMSLWAVDDAATSRLVTYFYPSFLGVGGDALPADMALASATRQLRSDLAEGLLTSANGTVLPDHPSLWAPFVVFGDGGYAYGHQ